MGWYWKRKPTWRKDLITYNSHPWIVVSFNWLVIIWTKWWGGGLSKIGCPRSKGWKNFGRRWTRWVGGLENWTSFIDAIWVSSLISNMYKFGKATCGLTRLIKSSSKWKTKSPKIAGNPNKNLKHENVYQTNQYRSKAIPAFAVKKNDGKK